jgi:non-ribosomal peptide synthetase component F
MLADLVPHAIASQAATTPDALAVAAPDGRLTYAELEHRATRLADALAALDVRRDDVVAVCLPRSAAFVVAALGVLKAGAAYLPIEPTTPDDRLAFMLADAAPRAIVTSGAHLGRLPDAGAPRLDLDAIAAADATVARRADRVKDGDLAYVIYTSGSTGRPKGVEVEHGSLANLVSWHCRAFGVTADDRAHFYASPAFDAAVWEIWPYLAAGASLHVPRTTSAPIPRRCASGWSPSASRSASCPHRSPSG